jgi:uncharacterized secreted protein with C-terminal beta-propeller domain
MAATASLALVLSSIAVQTGPGNPPAQAADELPAFRDCAELEAWYRAAALPLVGPFGLASADDGHATFAVAVRAESRTVAAAPGATGAQDAVGSNDRGTNVQEAEVDESDLVKTDGRFVYVASSGRLVVLDTAGGRLVRTARLALRDTPRELLLEGSRVLVVGNVERGIEKPQLTDGRRPVDGQRPMPGPRTTLALVDVSTPQAPRLLGSEEIDGRYVSARLTGGVARVVLASQPRLRFPAPRVLDYSTPEAPSVDGTGMPHRGPDGGRHFKLDDLIRMNKKTVAASTAARLAAAARPSGRSRQGRVERPAARLLAGPPSS